eukprot:Nk52_evm23s238 gene=Nk52_evmTU23s238
MSAKGHQGSGSGPRVSIGEGSVVCEHAVLRGTGQIKIGRNCVMHPLATLVVDGPGACIEIGDGNVFEEGSLVVCRDGEKVTIGNGNVLEVRATLVDSSLGCDNLLETRSHVNRHCHIDNACVIGINTVLPANTNLPSFTVCFGARSKRLSRSPAAQNAPPATSLLHLQQRDTLLNLLPKFHHLSYSSSPAGV